MRKRDDILAEESQPCDLSKTWSTIQSLLRRSGGKRVANYEGEFNLSLWRQSDNWLIRANSDKDFIDPVISCRCPNGCGLRVNPCKSWIQIGKPMIHVVILCWHLHLKSEFSILHIHSLKCPGWAAKFSCPVYFASIQVCTSSLATDKTRYNHLACWGWRKLLFMMIFWTFGIPSDFCSILLCWRK